MISEIDQKHQLPATTVIARPQAVAIPWYNVQLRTQSQEIAASLCSSQ